MPSIRFGAFVHRAFYTRWAEARKEPKGSYPQRRARACRARARRSVCGMGGFRELLEVLNEAKGRRAEEADGA